MLSYKKITSASLKSFKSGKTYLTALIITVPIIVYVIVSSILLSSFNYQLNEILNNFMDYVSKTEEMITSAVLNGYLSQIVDVFINNLHYIIIDIIISLVASIISSLLTFIAYYVAYDIVNKQSSNVKEILSNLWGGIVLTLLYLIKIFLWSLLFIIPGIIKTFSYALCFVIKIENPKMKARECIKKSVELMKGRKERLFIQYLIFILLVTLGTFIVSNVTMIVSIVPGFGSIVTGIINAFFNGITTFIWANIVCIYYNGVKEDEEYLSLHPELKKMGINGVLKDEKPKIRIQYGPYNRVQDPFKEEVRYKDPYQNNPFKNEQKPESKDPYED